MTYPVRTRIRYTATFTDSENAKYDPPDVTIEVTRPQEEPIEYTFLESDVQKTSTGIYYIDLDTTGYVGEWRFKAWSPTGSGQAATPAERIRVTQ